MIRHDLEAYREGFEAGWNAQSDADVALRAGDCPYPATSLGAYSWHSGFIEGDAQRPRTSGRANSQNRHCENT